MPCQPVHQLTLRGLHVSGPRPVAEGLRVQDAQQVRRRLWLSDRHILTCWRISPAPALSGLMPPSSLLPTAAAKMNAGPSSLGRLWSGSSSTSPDTRLTALSTRCASWSPPSAGVIRTSLPPPLTNIRKPRRHESLRGFFVVAMRGGIRQGVCQPFFLPRPVSGHRRDGRGSAGRRDRNGL